MIGRDSVYVRLDEPDREIFLEDNALAALLYDGVVSPFEGDRDDIICIWLGCNDLFVPAADGEPVPFNQIQRLYDMHVADPEWGSTQWCCLQRGSQPRPRIVSDMKAAGAWTEEMEKLSPNGCSY